MVVKESNIRDVLGKKEGEREKEVESKDEMTPAGDGGLIVPTRKEARAGMPEWRLPCSAAREARCKNRQTDRHRRDRTRYGIGDIWGRLRHKHEHI